MEDLNNIKADIEVLSLENAYLFEGKANPKAVLGKLIPKYPHIKSDLKTIIILIEEIVEKINNLTKEEQIALLEKSNKKFFEKQEDKKKENKEIKKDGLPVLENCENGVIVRFPPAPSGHLHLGHLFGIVANYEMKKKYGGKFILRFEDTNPENIDLSNYDKVIEDVKWICENEVDEIYYQSDRLDIYYKYLRTLFDLDKCYICNCESEVFKEYIIAKEQCPHAKMSREEQKKLFENFMLGNSDGVLRARADIENKNPALRTFPLARINKTPHARTKDKYSIWPNYNFACAIDDSLMNLTHVIRGKDLEIGEDRQKMIHRDLGLKSPIYFHYGRMKFENVDLSKTKLSELIKQGIYSGWDDPRVPSILSYRKRGYKAEAFRKFILSLGITKRDSKITIEEYHKGLDYFNKQILEEIAIRYFFVSEDYMKVTIQNIQKYSKDKIILPKHPKNKEWANRKFLVEKEYIIEKKDSEKLKQGDLFRLMHFANFKVIKKEKDILEVELISEEYDKNLKIVSNINFLGSQKEECEIIMNDNSKLKGFCEKIQNPTKNSSIQFERFGFVRFEDKIDNKLIFYFTQK